MSAVRGRLRGSSHRGWPGPGEVPPDRPPSGPPRADHDEPTDPSLPVAPALPVVAPEATPVVPPPVERPAPAPVTAVPPPPVAAPRRHGSVVPVAPLVVPADPVPPAEPVRVPPVAAPVEAREPVEPGAVPTVAAVPHGDLLPPPQDDFMPRQSRRSRQELRRRRARRRAGLLGTAVVLVGALAVGLLAWRADDTSPAGTQRSATRPDRPAAGATGSHTGVTSAPTSAANARDTGSAGRTADAEASQAPTVESVPTTVGTLPANLVTEAPASVTLTQDPGGCTFDPESQQLESTGTVTNTGPQTASIEVHVTWNDASGALVSSSDLFDLAPGASEPWDLWMDGWSNPVNGLYCTTASV